MCPSVWIKLKITAGLYFLLNIQTGYFIVLGHCCYKAKEEKGKATSRKKEDILIHGYKSLRQVYSKEKRHDKISDMLADIV